jgi:hypothetical protein
MRNQLGVDRAAGTKFPSACMIIVEFVSSSCRIALFPSHHRPDVRVLLARRRSSQPPFTGLQEDAAASRELFFQDVYTPVLTEDLRSCRIVASN